jgi:hypothetical protein
MLKKWNNQAPCLWPLLDFEEFILYPALVFRGQVVLSGHIGPLNELDVGCKRDENKSIALV